MDAISYRVNVFALLHAVVSVGCNIIVQSGDVTKCLQVMQWEDMVVIIRWEVTFLVVSTSLILVRKQILIQLQTIIVIV
jgi:hypothetical protein